MTEMKEPMTVQGTDDYSDEASSITVITALGAVDHGDRKADYSDEQLGSLARRNAWRARDDAAHLISVMKTWWV